MTAAGIIEELQSLGTDSYKRVLLNHGVPEPVLGVKIEELKKFQKRIKKDYRLALDLFDTGIYDAMYLAGMIADQTKMTKKDLRHWLAASDCAVVCGATVARVAAESRHGWDLGLEWIESEKENVAAAGWETLGGVVAVSEDADLDLPGLRRLLQRVEKTIHRQPDRVRYSMNGFIIAVGTYVQSLTDVTLKAAEKIGVVAVDMGNTACKVPFAPEYIQKARIRGAIGKKRRAAKY